MVVVSCTKSGGDCIPSITKCVDCSPDLYTMKWPEEDNWITFNFQLDQHALASLTPLEREKWLTDVLQQLVIDNRPVDKEILEKITDMDGPM